MTASDLFRRFQAALPNLVARGRRGPLIAALLAIAVALKPRFGGDLTALYLVLAACSVFSIGGMTVLGIMFLGAAVCALAMARLSTTYHR